MWLSTKCHNVALYTNAVEITSMNLIILGKSNFLTMNLKDQHGLQLCQTTVNNFLKRRKYGKVQGGRRPVNAPSIFHGVPKSCVKQVQSKKRSTSCTSADARQKEQQKTRK